MHDLGGCVKEDCEPLGLLSDISGGGTTEEFQARTKRCQRSCSFSSIRSESHLGTAGVRGHYFPIVTELLQVHGSVADYLYLGTWERGRPPGKG
jgi:hypothetical protein